jgi:hypothetical protein
MVNPWKELIFLPGAKSPSRPSATQAVMKHKVETRRTGERSRKCTTSTLQELSLRKYFFSEKKYASHQGKEPSLFRACAVFLAKKVFPAFYFALHDSLHDNQAKYNSALMRFNKLCGVL